MLASFTYPCIVPLPSLAQALYDPDKAATAFTTHLPSRSHSGDEQQVHHNWHWSFRRLTKAHSCVTLQEIGVSTVDHIYATPGLQGLDFLKDRAAEAPEWE